MGLYKRLGVLPPLLKSVDDLTTRITEALTINNRVWQEMEYGFDMRRVLRVRVLKICQKLNKSFISSIFVIKFFAS